MEPGTLKPTQTPLDNIGLAFSGGGYRAASFALGTLSYLNKIRWNDKSMLESVSYISSASGGSFTNAAYALSVVEATGFDAFYKKFFENIEGVKLLDRVFENLNDPDAWKDCPEKRRNMINAFALSYNQLFFEGKTVDDIMYKGINGPLDEICFNTTEFYHGLLFRQAVKLKPDSKSDKTFLYGNYIIHLMNHAEKHLKLADLVAASSCFPAGFEPILFPDEFIYNDTDGKIKAGILENLCIEPQELQVDELKLIHNDADVDNLVKNLAHPVNIEVLAEEAKQLSLRNNLKIGFMDGGITDNQGLESIMRANERRVNKETDFKEFDLMLICDVGSHYMDPYIPVKPKKYKGLPNLSIDNIFVIATVLLIAGIAAFIINYHLLAIPATLITATGLLTIAGLFLLRRFIAGGVRKNEGLNLSKNFSPEIVKEMFHHFGKTPIGAIADMLTERFNSVITLNNDIFLKRVRQLLYQSFFDEGYGSYRLKTNHIYDLSFSNDLNRVSGEGRDPLYLSPGYSMQIIAENAFEMGTTLWFEHEKIKDSSLASIIACGEFSTCYNLLVYIDRLKADTLYFERLSSAWQEKLNDLQGRLLDDYDKFKKDPFWLYNESGLLFHIANFKNKSVAEYKIPGKFTGLRN